MSSSDRQERAVVFKCGADRLVAVAHLPPQPRGVGVVIVVGGPQYRVGSHRQFLLLARELAAAGFAVFRFDYRGMGDSDGQLLGFEHITGDIRVAIDEFLRQAPSIQRIVLWGLCDGATACAAYAPTDRRVCGLALLNPWVRSDQTLARSILFHYYAKRMRDVAAWRQLIGDRYAWRKALSSFGATIGTVFGVQRSAAQSGVDANAPVETKRDDVVAHTQAESGSSIPLVARTATALDAFDGRVLVILSGADITANEFVEAVKSNRKLRRRMTRSSVTQHRLEHADHTFSTALWRDQVVHWTVDWLKTL